MIRSFGHEIVQDFSRFGSIPVVNALTDFLHPCQIYSDVFTLAEKWSGRGDDLDSLKGVDSSSLEIAVAIWPTLGFSPPAFLE